MSDNIMDKAMKLAKSQLSNFKTIKPSYEKLEAQIAMKNADIKRLAISEVDLEQKVHVLEAQIAMQAEALENLSKLQRGDLSAPLSSIVFTQVDAALSATSETVAAWRAKETELLRMEVAMLREFIENNSEADNSGGEYPSSCIACDRTYGKHVTDCELLRVLGNSQATALAYELEVKAKIVAWFKDQGHLDCYTAATKFEELRAANKGEVK